MASGQTKPQHFRDMLKIVWKNRDNLGYAWKVLSKGVCDGCALGVAGLARLDDRRPAPLHDAAESAAAEHDAGARSPRCSPTSRRCAELEQRSSCASSAGCRIRCCASGATRAFAASRWDDALDADRATHPRERSASGSRSSSPRAASRTRSITWRRKSARFLGTNNVDNAARLCHSPSTGAMKATLGVAASTCSYKDWYGTDLIVFFGSNPANDQPVATKYLHEAKKLGTKVVLVNPYLEPGMKRYWVPSSAEQRALRHGHRGLLVPGRARRRHRVPLRRAESPDRERLDATTRSSRAHAPASRS